jgi:hypothetical protein
MSTEQGSDPIGDFQRWLMRAGARSVSRDVAGRVKSAVNGVTGGGGNKADVWDTATTEELTDEPPECQWCPICRAARRYRDSGGAATTPNPTLSGQFAGVGDTLAGLTRDAFGLFDAAVRASQRPADGRPAGAPGPASARPASGAPAGPGTADAGKPAASAHGSTTDAPGSAGHGPSDHGSVVVGSGVGWPAVVHPQYQDDKAADERGDRQEGGQPGDGGAGGGADEQVERTAE